MLATGSDIRLERGLFRLLPAVVPMHWPALPSCLVLGRTIEPGMEKPARNDLVRLTAKQKNAGIEVLAIVLPDDKTDKNLMGVDKKVEAGRPRFVLFRKVVECRVKIDAPADLPRRR